MAEKSGAYASRAKDTDFRKKWDKEEYAEKARQRDQEEKERMQENEERMKQGYNHANCYSIRTLLTLVLQERNLAKVDGKICRSLPSS